ncbi:MULTISPECIES: dTDP-4-dehydrorhamnose 3,5-epimerase family protein [Streptomyces]|uniref:dTDP-4-dehydrorhamnose 3,5-epimerase family protein n=1 Tax=Streptomyces celluloflavus TaxID=58344 RepID=A0ABW7RAG5_9ACTN|nr:MULTISPECIES: dTDP-4-dehydrorhamnose 3,5-epimerase family protein [Streptomyces]WSK10724.1 dTDP-4-dehydrorhamnose 3,5-epimerase family protein [Streptomyces celluloflavus]
MRPDQQFDVSELKIPNAFRITPRKIPDRRGSFYEAFRSAALTEAIGYPFRIGQANYSVSRRGTLRGIHATSLPPGQAKLVTCVRGAVLDVAVDLRVGSPTFGEFEITHQDEESGVSVYMADGLGHAFLALTDDVCMNYLCSTEYVPGTMIDVNALDPQLGIPWNLTCDPVMSDKDAAAPNAAEAIAAGLLPTYDECLAHYARLRER